MNRRATKLSTAEERREAVIASAITVFARNGYLGTPIASVAEHAGISPAYVFKLFPGKVSLFVAAIDRCYEMIEQTLATGADRAGSDDPDDILAAMSDAYARLMADRDLITLQVHAQSASDIPEIGDAVRRGLKRVTAFAQQRSGAGGQQVQQFIAFGLLCQVVTILDLSENDEPGARLLSDGIRHYSEPDKG